MPSCRYTRIEITSDAYLGLEAEAVLQGKTLKSLASELILKGISSKAMNFVNVKSTVSGNPEHRPIMNVETVRSRRRPRLSSNQQAIEQIKMLWKQNPQPSRREIARQIGYPASSTKLFIKKMLERGEL